MSSSSTRSATATAPRAMAAGALPALVVAYLGLAREVASVRGVGRGRMAELVSLFPVGGLARRQAAAACADRGAARRAGRPAAAQRGRARSCARNGSGLPSAGTARHGTRSWSSNAMSCSMRRGSSPKRRASPAGPRRRWTAAWPACRWPSTTAASSRPRSARLRGKIKYRPVVFELMPPDVHAAPTAAHGRGARRRQAAQAEFPPPRRAAGARRGDRRDRARPPAAGRRASSASAARCCSSARLRGCACAPDGGRPAGDLPTSIQEPGRRAGLGDLRHLAEQAGADRNPVSHPRCGIVPLRIARHHHRLRRIDRRGRAQIVAEPRHVGGERPRGRGTGPDRSP